MSGPEPARERVREAALRVFGRRGAVSRMSPLPGGSGPRSFLVHAAGGPMVAKLAESGGGSTIAPSEEYALIEALAGADLTPRPHGFDAQSGTIFTAHLPAARTWTAADARDARNGARLARLLRRLHAIAWPVRDYDTRIFAGAYGASPDESDRLWQLARSVAGAGLEPVLCHNDLVASNILDDGRLWLIDFEYAARAPAIVDLASVAVMNEFDARGSRALLEAYGTPCSFETFDKAVQMQRLIAQLWTSARETS